MYIPYFTVRPNFWACLLDYFVLIVGEADVVEDGVSTVIALDSAIVALIGQYLCSQFLHSYVIFISSRIVHAFSVFR